MKDVFIENFLALAAIPRPSRHEEQVSRYLCERALSKGLAARRDAAGNVVIDRPAAPGFESAPLTLLQAHMDMVCVARPGTDWQPLTSPVEVVNDGKSLTARESSLGGDDGAGVALIQELLEDPELRCGALRGIFTTDEESGMSGALALDAKELDGKYLLNLDWEGTGTLCCSSAGSELYHFDFEPAWEESCGAAFSLGVRGLLGGHSGTMIHTGRANALRAIALFLQRAMTVGIPLRLATFHSGTAANAIPCEGTATLVIPAERADAFRRLIDGAWERFLLRYGELETGAAMELQEIEQPAVVLTREASAKLLGFLCEAHTGVYTMSAACPGLVESSANLSEVHADRGGVCCEVFQRSSDPAVTETMRRQYALLAGRSGAAMQTLHASPAWPFKAGNRLVGLCSDAWRALTGREMRVEPVHAGLECSFWAQKAPALDMISIGPDVEDIHSPDERLDLGSVDDLDRLVRQLLAEISRE